MGDFENFEKAFDVGVGACSRMCECGRKFYNPDPTWDFEEGELEELENDPTATALDYSIGIISFEGSEYALDCNCWHERAKQIISFINNHAYKIADYLTLEKKRKTQEAKMAPIVRDS